MGILNTTAVYGVEDKETLNALILGLCKILEIIDERPDIVQKAIEKVESDHTIRELREILWDLCMHPDMYMSVPADDYAVFLLIAAEYRDEVGEIDVSDIFGDEKENKVSSLPWWEETSETKVYTSKASIKRYRWKFKNTSY